MYKKIHTYLRNTPAKQRTRAGIVFGVLVIALIIYTHTPKPGTVSFTKEYSMVLTDYSGNRVRFDSLEYKPLVVFFWATWCPYCKGELQHLGELKTQYGDAVQIVAVNRKESLADAKGFTDALALPPGMVFLLDDHDALFKDLGGYAMPETIFINSHGEQVVHQHVPMSASQADQAIQKITH